MKTIQIIAILMLAGFFNPAEAKNKEIIEDTVRVEGACNMCKERIENAALIKGVKFAEWNKETKVLNLVSRSDKTSKKAITEAILETGHDVNKQKAKQEAYKKLPDCCKYRDGVKTH